MKGIYLSQEGKREIETKIGELENQLQLVGNAFEDVVHNYISNKINVYKEILSSAIIIPVEESWETFNYHGARSRNLYPNGVIIQPKN
jgi:hypothetical protein